MPLGSLGLLALQAITFPYNPVASQRASCADSSKSFVLSVLVKPVTFEN